MSSEAFLTKVNEVCGYTEAVLNATNFPGILKTTMVNYLLHKLNKHRGGRQVQTRPVL
jgi:hypothetical protein